MSFIKPARHVSRVFLHCSASDAPSHDDVSVIRKWHTDPKPKGRGWSDVGYHYFIKKNGEIQEGRPLSKIPAAQHGHNTGTIAICLHGLKDFRPEQRLALKELCHEINSQYQVLTFHGHCEVSKKSCPVFPYKEWLNLDEAGFIKIPKVFTAPPRLTWWQKLLNKGDLDA